MPDKISRRKFFNSSFGMGAGFLFSKNINIIKRSKTGKVPLIVTSHGNDLGKSAMEGAWEILMNGGSVVDAVEKGANIIEVDPDDSSVGYGGTPNENGVVQLDSCIMDGKTYNAGAVACIENIKTPSSVARIVMEKTDHVLLVGKGALDFAKRWGFKEENLLTERSRKAWLKWRENLNPDDDWGPPDHLRKKDMGYYNPENDPDFHYGTTNVLAVDKNGDIAGITTTSGLSWKIPGRVGDSPIIGAGLYVDNEVGAAGATGRGEDVIKSCATYYIVLKMKEGRTPQQACEDALNMIIDKYKKVNPDYIPGEKFVAINKDGEVGASGMPGEDPRNLAMATVDGIKIYEGTGMPKR
ncbi:N(4)-(beta-N-acetylglucosaminyl)-L-asparaginase [candidate division KSB1 bacterium]